MGNPIFFRNPFSFVSDDKSILLMKRRRRGDVPDGPDGPDGPDMPDVPDVPDMPDVPDVQDVPDVPGVWMGSHHCQYK